MGRLMKFVFGFIFGFAIGSVAVLLATPQSGEEIRELFDKAFAERKSELENRLVHFNRDGNY